MLWTESTCAWMSPPMVPPKISSTVLTWLPTNVLGVELVAEPEYVAGAHLARLGAHLEQQVGAARRHAHDQRPVDVPVERDHARVDRLEEVRLIEVQTSNAFSRQSDRLLGRPAPNEGDLEGLAGRPGRSARAWAGGLLPGSS